MKKGFFISILGLMVASMVLAGGITEKGNGNILTSDRVISPFEKINNGSEAVVRFHVSDEYRVLVTTDSNMDKYIIIASENKTLKIKNKWHIFGSYRFTQLTVDVFAPTVAGVAISGSGRFESTDVINAQTVDLQVSGSGTLDGNLHCSSVSINISGSGAINGSIDCDNAAIGISGSGAITENIVCDTVSVRISGSGKTTLIGNVKNADIGISGSGNFYANELRAENIDIHISGSGSANVWAEDGIKADVSGSGGITYRGNPKLNFSGSGSGRIKSE